MLIKKLFLTIFLALLLLPNTVQAKTKLLYIPLDNRPVCLSYVTQTIVAAGYEVTTPPEHLLASENHHGNPDALWNWLIKTIPTVDAAVLSTDSLLYGGLVASRTHEFSTDTIHNRVERIAKLKNDFPLVKIYAFSTIMRTPRQSFGNVEPEYYTKYGPDLFKLTELNDKEESLGLTKQEEHQRNLLKLNIPAIYLNDWFDRRQKNYEANLRLIKYSQTRSFHFFAIGKDDDAPLSQTHMESRHLTEAALLASLNKFIILPGVDQLGLLLLTRAINDAEYKKPIVNVIYADGVGKNTLPYYSDQRLSSSIPDQIGVAGGRATEFIEEADLILAVNAPYDGITKDATYVDNLYFSSKANLKFAAQIKKLIRNKKDIALADVAYANGADNGFMLALHKEGLLEHLAAYSGWNTADNTVGFALAQGLLSRAMTSQDKITLLHTRYLDDWLYQANIRTDLRNYINRRNPNIIYDLTPQHLRILATTQRLYKDYLDEFKFLKQTSFDIDFPWNRLFEINIITNATKNDAKK